MTSNQHMHGTSKSIFKPHYSNGDTSSVKRHTIYLLLNQIYRTRNVGIVKDVTPQMLDIRRAVYGKKGAKMRF